jgi:HEAT repeat protein
MLTVLCAIGGFVPALSIGLSASTQVVPGALTVLLWIAAACLARNVDWSSRGRVVELLNSPDGLIRHRGVRTLDQGIKVGDVDFLITVLMHPELPAEHVPKVALALGQLGDVRAVEPLEARLRVGADPRVRRAALLALRKIGAADAKIFVAALEDADPAVREGAQDQLLHLGKPAVEALLPLLDASDPHLRQRAVEILLKLGDERALEPLAARQNDRVIQDAIGETVVRAPFKELQAQVRASQAAEAERLRKASEAEAAEAERRHEAEARRHQAMSEDQLISLLIEVAQATMGNAPDSLATYEQRRERARLLGEELYRRGGMAAMKRALDEGVGPGPDQRTIDQFWNGIGDWLG